VTVVTSFTFGRTTDRKFRFIPESGLIDNFGMALRAKSGPLFSRTRPQDFDDRAGFKVRGWLRFSMPAAVS
jgi:hypothetical protein